LILEEKKMSLPSILAIARERNVELSTLSHRERELVLVEAMRRDMRPAVELLESVALKARETGSARWDEDPNSEIGKMLIRIHAGTTLRRLASEHFCHGLPLTFYNCCRGTVGEEPDKEEQTKEQIQSQDGTIAYADC
jgi:hypothetical protein